MDLGLTDRVYILTGASRGLGRATAEALVADGARVVISGRDGESLAETVVSLGADRAEAVVADNAQVDTPARLMAAAHQRWGRLDGALISVGGPAAGSVASTTDEQWTAGFESVFLGTVRLAREIGAALPDGGSLALVLSTSVRVPLAGLAASNGFRPGLAAVAKMLADDLGPAGVRVNTLLPGRIDTDRVKELDAGTGDAEASRARHQATIPLGRYGRPDEFGRAAAFVLSPAASFISGISLPIDGGLLRTV